VEAIKFPVVLMSGASITATASYGPKVMFTSGMFLLFHSYRMTSLTSPARILIKTYAFMKYSFPQEEEGV
jgi:hypothetical protein